MAPGPARGAGTVGQVSRACPHARARPCRLRHHPASTHARHACTQLILRCPASTAPTPPLTARRLLHDLQRVERNLTWWGAQFAHGTSASHSRFMLLGRGPFSFLSDVSRLIIGSPPVQLLYKGARSALGQHKWVALAPNAALD